MGAMGRTIDYGGFETGSGIRARMHTAPDQERLCEFRGLQLTATYIISADVLHYLLQRQTVMSSNQGTVDEFNKSTIVRDIFHSIL